MANPNVDPIVDRFLTGKPAPPSSDVHQLIEMLMFERRNSHLNIPILSRPQPFFPLLSLTNVSSAILCGFMHCKQLVAHFRNLLINVTYLKRKLNMKYSPCRFKIKKTCEYNYSLVGVLNLHNVKRQKSKRKIVV